MTLAAHRPARPLSSLQGEDPAELAVALPGLPRGVTLDPQVLRDAACGDQDLELFYPDPGDLETEQAAKQVCASCPVKQPCLEMALQTGDQHAILGGTTPDERGRLRRQRQVTHAREQAAQRATAATGIDPAQVKAPAGRSMAAHLLGDASATLRAWELCKTAGTAHVARLLGVHVTDLHKALTHWGLEVPRLRQPAEILEDPVAAREAFGLVEQVGWVKGAQQLHVHRRTLRAAFQRWGLGEPTPPPGPCAPSAVARDRSAAEEALELAIQVGVQGAAERLGVNRVTLYLAWRRWGLGRPTDRPEGARATAQLDRSVWQPRQSTRSGERATAEAER
jgi:WhiB family transcriptional regulator, redox-sensing transcriptional regulator